MSVLTTAIILANLTSEKIKQNKIKTFSWKERDRFLDNIPKPQALKDKQKKNRAKKQKRKAKRGY